MYVGCSEYRPQMSRMSAVENYAKLHALSSTAVQLMLESILTSMIARPRQAIVVARETMLAAAADHDTDACDVCMA